MNGDIDLLSVYDSGLSEEEIKGLHEEFQMAHRDEGDLVDLNTTKQMIRSKDERNVDMLLERASETVEFREWSYEVFLDALHHLQKNNYSSSDTTVWVAPKTDHDIRDAMEVSTHRTSVAGSMGSVNGASFYQNRNIPADTAIVAHENAVSVHPTTNELIPLDDDGIVVCEKQDLAVQFNLGDSE